MRCSFLKPAKTFNIMAARKRKTILWLDNDPAYINPFVLALRDDKMGPGCDVKVITTVTEAEHLIEANREDPYNLLILDVMIPTKNEEEEKNYPPSETADGRHTGLVFYKNMGKTLAGLGTRVLAMTVRLDSEISRDFVEAGLPEKCFATKLELRDITAFLSKVNHLLEGR